MTFFFNLVYALWLLSMSGHVSLRLDLFTNTYCPCSSTSIWNIESTTNQQIVNDHQNDFVLRTKMDLYSSSNRLFEPAQIIDIVKGLVIFGCAIPMCFMDISVVYHTVRAQAAIKLYMFFNMLEVSTKKFHRQQNQPT